VKLIAVAVLSTAGARSAPRSEMPRFYAGAGLSALFFVGEDAYDTSLMLDAAFSYDFASGSNVEMMVGYVRMADLQSSALDSVPIMLSLKLGREWVWQARSGRYYVLLSGGGLIHRYDLSASDEKVREESWGYDNYDYTVDSGLAWCLGGGVEFYSYTNKRMYLDMNLYYMWHEAKATTERGETKVSETLDLDALVFRVGLTFQF